MRDAPAVDPPAVDQSDAPEFTIADPTGEPSDEAIEALARLLLEVVAEPTTSTTTTDVATKKSRPRHHNANGLRKSSNES